MTSKIGLMVVVLHEGAVIPTNRVLDLGEVARRIGAEAVTSVFNVFDPPQTKLDEGDGCLPTLDFRPTPKSVIERPIQRPLDREEEHTDA